MRDLFQAIRQFLVLERMAEVVCECERAEEIDVADSADRDEHRAAVAYAEHDRHGARGEGPHDTCHRDDPRRPDPVCRGELLRR